MKEIPSLSEASFVHVWRKSIRRLPIESANSVVSMLIDALLSIMNENEDILVLSQLLFECFHVIGRDKVLDVVEVLWNGHNDPKSLQLLSFILCHCDVLSYSDLLFILCQMCSEAQPSAPLLSLVLHVLLCQYTNFHKDLKSVQVIITWLQTAPDPIWKWIPPVVKQMVSRVYSSLSLCCSKWCVHLCKHCQSLHFLYSYLSCPYCSPSLFETVFEKSCSWKEGDLEHFCKACQKDCCSELIHGANPYSTCLCSQGRYTLTYNYDLFDSGSSENEFEDKRRHVEYLQQVEQEIQERMIWWNRMNADVLLRVCDYLPYSSLVAFECVNSDMESIVRYESVWKSRYRQLFQSYHCVHPKGYHHNYYKMVVQRIKSMKRRKRNEHLCEYCGCHKRFSSAEEYEKHIQEKHVALCVC